MLRALNILFICTLALAGTAQVSLEPFLATVRNQHPELRLGQSRYQTELLQARTGISPPNPEVAFSYLWGTPELLGNQVDFGVSQTIDFPTVYSSKSKLSKIGQHHAGLRYALLEQEVVSKARKLWLEAVYLNVMDRMLGERLENAVRVHDAYRKMYTAGEVDQLEYNQSLLRLTTLKNQRSKVQMEQEQNGLRIAYVTGDAGYLVTDTVLPSPKEISLETLRRDYDTSLRRQLFITEVERKEQERSVAFNSKLPQITAGYYRETILGTKLEGLQAGLSIPLWGDRHKVRLAEAEVAFAESDAEQFGRRQEAELNGLYERWQALKGLVEELDSAISAASNEQALLKLLSAGEISLTQYYYESDFFYESRMALVEQRKEMLLVEAELLKIYP